MNQHMHQKRPEPWEWAFVATLVVGVLVSYVLWGGMS